MNNCLYWSLIMTFMVLFFPSEIVSHTDRIMEIMKVSLSGTTGSGSEFCRHLQTLPSVAPTKNNASVSIWLLQRFGPDTTTQLMCKSSFAIVSRTSCSETIFDQLNEHLTVIPSFPFSPQVPTEVFVTLHRNKSHKTLRSDQIETHGSTSELYTEDIHIKMAVNITARFRLVYRSRCAENYYGVNCDHFCEARDNSSGHYNCTDDGRQVCLPGWEGLFCTEAICNGCVNGQCFAPDKCKCYHGWIGPTCSICQKSAGCKHGTCNSNAGIPFTCVCKPGWGGQHCDIDLKYCLTHQDQCKNNGTCHNYYGDSRIHYLCKCRPGYSGRHCHIKTGVCTIHNESLSYKCLCHPGFSGLYCQISEALQQQFPAEKRNVKSDGFCISPDEGYSCSCSRFQLKMCQCKFIKCSNKSTCNDRTTPHVFCSNGSNIHSHWEFSSNFGFGKYSLTASDSKPTSPDYHFVNDPFLKLYIGFIFIPILLAVLLLFLVIFRYFRRKQSNVCIKTIHNNLQLPNNMAQAEPFQEQKILLHQIPLSTSLQNNTLLNNCSATMKNTLTDIAERDITWKSDEPDDDYKYDVRDSTNYNSGSCNPNLLINHYKDMHENIK